MNNASPTPVPLTYDIVFDERDANRVLFVGMDRRTGRFPLRSAYLTAAAHVIMEAQDGTLEEIGEPGKPLPSSLVRQLRENAEGALFVELDEDGTAYEYLVRAGWQKPIV